MKRRGSTLIEVAMALPAICMLLVLALQIVHHAFRSASFAKDRDHTIQVLSRLERQVREDFHEATLGQTIQPLNPQTNQFELRLTDGSSVDYQWNNSSIVRSKKVQDEAIAIDKFPLFENLEVDFQIEDVGTKQNLPFQRIAFLIYRAEPGASENKRLELHVRAMIPRQPLLLTGEKK
jgi:type II secretory pathway component PulJ